MVDVSYTVSNIAVMSFEKEARTNYIRYTLTINNSDGTVIGFGKLIVEYYEKQGCWHIELMDCEPRRHGIGTELFTYMINDFKAMYPLETQLTVCPASDEGERFFIKMGFVGTVYRFIACKKIEM